MTERKTKNYDFSFCLPFWDALSEDQRNQLRRNTIVRSYRAGDSVEFTMPEKNGLFMVLEGALRVYIAVASGREITLMIQHPGSCCYLLTLDSAAAGDTVPILQASCDSVFAYINTACLEPLSLAAPEITPFLVRTAAANMQTVLNNIEFYFFNPLRSGIARVLLEKVESHPEDGFARITHEEIARHLGTTREVISREIDGLRQLGLLRTSRGKIRIENWASLEELAQVSKASPGRVPRRK